MKIDAIIRWGASIHFCDTQPSADGKHVTRRRRPAARVLIGMANLELAAQQSPVRFLHTGAWLRHEAAIYGRLGVPVAQVGRTLVIPKFPGRTLAAWLDDPTVPAAAKVEAFGLAAKALLALHSSGVSNGDAHASNVLVDLAMSEANWIDFESRHLPNVIGAERAVDDLRALVTSSLFHVAGTTAASELGQALAESQWSADVLGVIAGVVMMPARTLLERMQGDPDQEKRSAFVGALRAFRKSSQRDQ